MEHVMTLILYVLHEENDRFYNFIKRGLIDSETRKYIIIYNNPNYPTCPNWDFINKYDNVHLFNRKNIGHDFGGWNDALFLPSTMLNKKIISLDDIDHKDK